ncbi:hypothetical protein [Nakamurella multipartita]|jgi:hypothetical protein|uniref:Uncharacterized protein n=1 Tax=Nakamurella multipartita (strain ATCC 700099 / DSM 44233 / CIP 104796 / JCM 9543 / NBRC 105858 / Y-104) TaxID=479431 RepID=C8XEL1_NAKMY|nr:hypothetical protein [Nakamurella multipartita]ACV77869.1 hypothetical protein Namu_1470 [Nakamurella multipartita DSM 44233]HOZ59186.1 hypothetical protein [Nakamurella multipartita]
MSTSPGYPGSGNDPYSTPNQPSAAGANPYEQPSYPPVGQYPGGAQGYPPAGAYGAGPTLARPGMVTAAAVLAFVVGGLAILGGLLALFAGSALTGYIGGLGGLVIVISILILAVGALYIWAGVMALQGKNAKILTIVAIAASALQLLSMISDFSTSSLIGLAISVAIIALLLQPVSKAWFKAKGAPTF